MTELNPYAPPSDDSPHVVEAAAIALGEPLASIRSEVIVAKRKRDRLVELHRDALVLRASGSVPRLLLTRLEVSQTLTVARTITRFTLRFSGQPELVHQVPPDALPLLRAWLQPMPEGVVRAAVRGRFLRVALFLLLLMLSVEALTLGRVPWVSTGFVAVGLASYFVARRFVFAVSSAVGVLLSVCFLWLAVQSGGNLLMVVVASLPIFALVGDVAMFRFLGDGPPLDALLSAERPDATATPPPRSKPRRKRRAERAPE